MVRAIAKSMETLKQPGEHSRESNGANRGRSQLGQVAIYCRVSSHAAAMPEGHIQS
jgi:hypothetical protein